MRQPKTIAVLTHPNAGKKKAESRVLARNAEPMLRESFGRRAQVVVYWSESLEELAKAVWDAAHVLNADVIVIVGGDGSMHQVLTRLIPACRAAGREIPLILLVPAGTMNVVSQELKLTDADKRSALERTITNLRMGYPKIVQAHALRVNDRYGFLYGAGLPVNALERYNAYEERGMLRAAQVGAGIVCEEVLAKVGVPRSRPSVADPFNAVILGRDAESDHLAGSKAWTGILAGTIESVGLYSRPIYRAREKEGHFHLIAAEHGFWGFALRGLSIVRGASLGGKIDHPLISARIGFASPILRFIDGDVYDEDAFGLSDELECGPLISFLAP